GSNDQRKQAGNTEGNKSRCKILAPLELLCVILGPKKVEARGKNPGAQDGIENQQIRDIVRHSLMGQTCEKPLQQTPVPIRKPGFVSEGVHFFVDLLISKARMAALKSAQSHTSADNVAPKSSNPAPE